jgi:hypothetical protein
MMKPKISIYLAGKIQKAHEGTNECYWTQENLDSLRTYLSEFEITFLNPAIRSDDLSDQRSVFGRDILQVTCSDIVFADIRDRRGIGVGAEMMWAKIHKIPLVTWAPRDSHYYKSQTTLLNVPVKDWIHPFVFALSDYMAETLKDASEYIRKVLTDPDTPIKGIDYIESAMHYYKDSQLHTDIPMKDLLASHDDLKSRVQLL